MGTLNIAYKQELGGWPYQNGYRAVLVKVNGSADYDGTGDTIPIAALGFRRLHTAFTPCADLSHAANQDAERVYGTVVDYGPQYETVIAYGDDDDPLLVWDGRALHDNLSAVHKWLILVGSV